MIVLLGVILLLVASMLLAWGLCLAAARGDGSR